MFDPAFLAAKHEAGLPYETYVRSGTTDQFNNWQRIYDRATLTDAQRTLVRSFTRRINVLIVTGIWCGDCVQQGPLIQRVSEANPEKVVLRWLDRDKHPDLAKPLRINAGDRVPVVVFAAEDFEPVGWFGDRTLSRYRVLARKALGAACPLPGAPVDADELAVATQEWVDQFERVHLLLRLSGRLRQRHGD